MKIKLWMFLFFSLIGVSFSVHAEDRISLDSFLGEVRAQNLSLKVSSAQTEAAKANAVGISLPPPMVALTQMQDQSGQAGGFEISQSVPFPTKLSNERSSRGYESQAREKMSLVTGKQIFAQGRLLYFNLWREQERLELLQEKRAVIQQHIRLATAGARSDNFLRIHVLKAESDFDLLESEILVSQQSLREIQIQMAEFINKDPSQFKPVVDEPSLAPLPTENDLSTPVQIQAKELEFESLKSKESETKATWFPDLNLRYRESGGTSMNPRYNEVMLGVTLPFIFFWEPKATSNKAFAERLQGELELNQEKRKIDSRKTSLLAKGESLRKQLNLFKEKLLPRAEKRMHLVHNLAPRNMETLQDHRETMEAFPDLKMKVLDLRTQYEEVAAELQTYSSEKPQ